MRLSRLFLQPLKTPPKDVDSVNGRLLIQAGFVDMEMAGVYSWLSLGLRVLRKVENIVREEMNLLGANEIFMPSLQPKEYWEATKRWDSVDILFKLKSQTKKDYALGCSHEEVVTPLVGKFTQSYRDLPLAVYQINTKFRDELRAKSGVLRGREFRMKDMYSFHTTQEDLMAFYGKTLEAYVKVFARCGVQVKVVQASGGIFTDNLSHEFQALTPAGEDDLIVCEKCRFGQNAQVATLKEGANCPDCGGKLVRAKGIEVGNIFDLGTKYTDAFDFDIAAEDGKQRRVLMGCYGIGTTRLVGAIVEASHDESGIIWPKSVAPFAVHLISLKGGEEAAEKLYNDLTKAKVEVLFDDRVASAGEKFANADLIGCPVRLVVSAKTLAKDAAEWKERAEEETKFVLLNSIVSLICTKSGQATELGM